MVNKDFHYSGTELLFYCVNQIKLFFFKFL